MGRRVPAVDDSKFLVQAGWSDAAHLDAATKERMLAGTPPHLRDARSKGTPSLGAGAIYPVEQSEIIVPPFAIPAHFAKAYGFDTGWKRTAAVFGAWDRDSDVLYIYTEHYRGQAEPSIHADAIRARGDWLVGACDPAGSTSGETTLEIYRSHGLNLVAANKNVEAGIMEVWQRLATGRLKIFAHCGNLIAEHRLYRRDKNGKIVKDFDHALDALRYLVMSLPQIARTKPIKRPTGQSHFATADRHAGY